jgi:hypothetical protein
MSDTPCSKKGYPTKKDAFTARNARLRGRQQTRRHRPKFLRAYHCELCNQWHLTHHYTPPPSQR